MKASLRLRAAFLVLAVTTLISTTSIALAQTPTSNSDTVLHPPDMAKILPGSVFFRGQSATTQGRNSGGVRYADGFFTFASLVDNSGYSTGIQEKYQAYFITEVPIKIGGQSLPAGVYGVGFIADNKFVITDVGAHDLVTTSYATDDGLKRPMPLQVMTDPVGGFRLYAGRKYVAFSR